MPAVPPNMSFRPFAPTMMNPRYSVCAWVVVAIAAVVCFHSWAKPGKEEGAAFFLQSRRRSAQRDRTQNNDNDWIVQLHEFTWTEGPKSQGAQDIYLFGIFNMIGATNRYFVEFGFNEPSYTSYG